VPLPCRTSLMHNGHSPSYSILISHAGVELCDVLAAPAARQDWGRVVAAGTEVHRPIFTPRARASPVAAFRILCETILPTVKALPACFATITGCVVAATAPGTNLASALRISAALDTPFILVVMTAMRLLEAMGRAMQRPC
jgi:hypothetical protein